MANLPQQSEILLLTERVTRLEKRLAALENRLIEPVGDDGVIDLSQSRYRVLSNNEGDSIEPEPVVSKRGRPPIIPRAQLARQRDDLINFLEPRWPDLLTHMRRPKSIEHLLQAIERASPGAVTNWPYCHLKENIAELSAFLWSREYKGNPREIAYAMAGVPDMTCRSSLDACKKHPSRLHIHPAAFTDHIRKHDSELLRALLAEGAIEKNLRRLAKHCGECRRLAGKPELVLKALEEGRPLIV